MKLDTVVARCLLIPQNFIHEMPACDKRYADLEASISPSWASGVVSGISCQHVTDLGVCVDLIRNPETGRQNWCARDGFGGREGAGGRKPQAEKCEDWPARQTTSDMPIGHVGKDGFHIQALSGFRLWLFWRGSNGGPPNEPGSKRSCRQNGPPRMHQPSSNRSSATIVTEWHVRFASSSSWPSRPARSQSGP